MFNVRHQMRSHCLQYWFTWLKCSKWWAFLWNMHLPRSGIVLLTMVILIAILCYVPSVLIPCRTLLFSENPYGYATSSRSWCSDSCTVPCYHLLGFGFGNWGASCLYIRRRRRQSSKMDKTLGNRYYCNSTNYIPAHPIHVVQCTALRNNHP